MEKSDFIRDKCPCCNGLGVLLPDPSTPITKPLPPDPKSPGESQFQSGPEKCPECGGSGRVPKGK
jgi:DnaJ-class molecular chaperone